MARGPYYGFRNRRLRFAGAAATPGRRPKADRKARRERLEAFRKRRDEQAASRGRLRGKGAGKPLDTAMRPGKGVKR